MSPAAPAPTTAIATGAETDSPDRALADSWGTAPNVETIPS